MDDCLDQFCWMDRKRDGCRERISVHPTMQEDVTFLYTWLVLNWGDSRLKPRSSITPRYYESDARLCSLLQNILWRDGGMRGQVDVQRG